MSQTYIFTVAVTGEDVQDAAEALREGAIDMSRAQLDGDASVTCHVTESVRVSE